MAFIPLKDDNPLERIRFQTVTVLIIALCAAVFPRPSSSSRQFVSASFDDGTGGGTAWWAPIGGFVAGLVLVIPMQAGGLPLFDRTAREPDGNGSPDARSTAGRLRTRRSKFPDRGGRGV